MRRGKVVMKRIENAASRLVSFSKRRDGLLKKAFELSVLCDVEVAVIIFSQKGRLYEFSSSDMQKTIERYCMYTKGIPTHKLEMEQHMQHMRIETENMVKKIEFLEVSKRKLLGQGLGSCSVEELQEIDSQLEESLKNIRARKAQLYKEQIQELKAKERKLSKENAKLCEKAQLYKEHIKQLKAKGRMLLEENGKLCEKERMLLEENVKLCEKYGGGKPRQQP